MSYNKISEFYKKILNDKSFNSKLLKIKNETETISDPQKIVQNNK